MTTYKTYGDGVTTVYNSSSKEPPTGVTKSSADISHPVHYNQGIECWDYIISHGLGFLEGNIIKYVTRYRHKNGKADLLKAREYLNKLITEYEKSNE